MATVMITLRDLEDGAVDIEVMTDPTTTEHEADTPAQALAANLLSLMQSAAEAGSLPVLTLATVDPERPGQFIGDLVSVAERHATAAADATLAPALLLGALVAAAERYGQGIGIGAQMVTCGDLMRNRACQRMAAEITNGETVGA